MLHIAPVQPLILTGVGIKPTVPVPSTIMPTDSRFNRLSNIMIGQLAYNVDDDIWYYRHSTGIKPFSGGEITVNDVEVWRSDKNYRAGNTYVSYVNPGSSDPQFQTEAIYRCDINTIAGESPESAFTKWIFQGTSVNFDNIEAKNVIYDNTTSGLSADRVQAALDELAASIAAASSTGNNVGTGEGIYKDNNVSVLNFKSLTAGRGIDVTPSQDGNEIEISTDGDANAAENLGLPLVNTYGVYKDLSTPNNILQLKSLTGGPNITLSESGDGNRIIVTGPSVPVKSFANIAVSIPTPNGQGEIYHSLSPTGLVNLRRIVGGDNVIVEQDDVNDIVIIKATGEANTCSSLGTILDGEEICGGKTGVNINFKRIKGGDHIQIDASNPNRLVINTDGPINNIENITGDPQNPTTPDGLFKQIDPATKNAQFRTLVGGDNVSVAVDGDNIRISASAVGDENAATNVSDSAGAAGIATGQLDARAIELRSLRGEGDVTAELSPGGNEVLIKLSGDPIHIDVPNEFGSANQIIEIDPTDRVLVEDASDGFSKAYASINKLGFIKSAGVDIVNSDAQSITLNLQRDFRQVNIAAAVNTLTATINMPDTGINARMSGIIFYNQGSSTVTITLNGITQFEGGLESPLVIEPGYTRLQVWRINSRTYASYAAGGNGGGGASERENTTVAVSANTQTTTVDFSGVGVKTLSIADTINTHTIAVGNLSDTERYNTLVIDNSVNTVGLTVTFNDQTGTIKYRGAKNDFPGTYPNMNVPAGTIWEVSFENRSATVTTVNFEEIEIYA